MTSQTPPAGLSTASSAAAANALGSIARGLPQRGDRRRDRGAHERDHRRGGHLLDSAPERIRKEKCRLRPQEPGEGAQRARRHEPRGRGIDRESEHRAVEGDRRLEEPRDVLAGQLPAETEGHERTERVAAAVQVVVEHLLVGGRRKAGERPAVVHHPVGQCEPRRRVVEGDVPGERRLPGEDDRRRIRRECARAARRRPGARPAEAAASEAEAGEGEGDRGGRCEPGGRTGHRREVGLDDEDREPEREEQGARKRDPGQLLDEEPAAE